MDQVLKNSVVNKAMEEVPVSKFTGPGTVVGIYFSAHWCPPCRGFTPTLSQFYNEVTAAGNKFEVVFVSSDRDEESFKDYFADMPWLAVPFNSEDRASLKEKYGITGIPTLVILNGRTGELITKSGRGDVANGASAYDKWLSACQ